VKRSRIPGRILSLLVMLFLYAPIIIMIIFSFNNNPSKSRTVWTGFTFDWYIKLFGDAPVLNALYTSLVLALLSAAIATVIGTISAIGIYGMKPRARRAVLSLNNIPVVNPEIITGVSLSLVFILFVKGMSSIGIAVELGFWSLLIAHITFNVPFVILSVLPKLRQLSKNVYEAALDLGATPFKAYMKVIIPEIMPGIISGAVIAFTMSIDDFIISYFTAGMSVQTLPMYIYSMTRKRVSPEINALSSLLFVSVLLLLLIINIIQVKDKKRSEINRR